MKLNVVDLSFAYNSHPVLEDINLITDEKITAILGPNGAGKSTLLSCIAGIRKPQGTVYLDNTSTADITPDNLSRAISYLPQDNPSGVVMSVLEAVLLGRIHSLKWKVPDEDVTCAYDTLTDLGIENLAERNLTELSDGQRQMVSIAQAIAKDPRILLMDEPTNSLDLQHQLELFDLIREVTEDRKITSLIALHDLNLAARYADNVVVLHSGKVSSYGPPDEVFTCEMIEKVYGVHADVTTDSDGYIHVCPKCSVKQRTKKISRRTNT
ncbi:MAG TPA: ABC transporter ATP-binding protein [Methanospirillum sp.]|uniref:ABC transporter ATP-binding protein n=1 Tax=Methanospirillum sp. TaxID=45200 RepID=UPI002C1950C6|nr:ABC transporter ATP-binding protein [Methanospirillum sp.]HWQ63627.1 ABC transporter ATP-binding protein [Methanospirillum sp.]